MPKTRELRSKTMVTSDEPQAQRSRDALMTRSEAHVSEVSEGQPGSTERIVEVQHPEWDGDDTLSQLVIVEQLNLLRTNLEQIRHGVLLPHPALARVKRRLRPHNLYRSQRSLLSWQLCYHPNI